jgi:DNA-binding response OmpR family regulator
MSQRILLLDDEEKVVRFLTQMVEMRYKVEIDSAGTVGEASELVRSHNYQAMVLDNYLPDGTGAEMILELSPEVSQFKEIPLLLLSGIPYEDQTPEFKEVASSFSNAHLRSKPVNVADFLKILDTCLTLKDGV